MLNKQGERELAYIVQIDAIEPIEGSDNCECAVVGGWRVMVRKNTFEQGNSAIYFEIDSQLDMSKPEFAFMQHKKGRVKTQKYTFGGKNPGFYSQGLLMHPSDFGWTVQVEPLGGIRTEVIIDDKGKPHYPDDESRFLTKTLGVTYYVAEDNERKKNRVDKYKRMAARHYKLFSKPPYRWLMQRDWGKKFLFLIYGNKRTDGGTPWPSHICSKTDVERIQNMPFILQNKNSFVATEKVDGSSCTVAVERGRFRRLKYYVCSRNVVFDRPDKPCYYDTNIYLEAYEKYNLKEKITAMMNHLNASTLALQMEIYGEGVQKRDYSTKDKKIAVFHIVCNGTKLPMTTVASLCEQFDIPHVPIVCDKYIFPNTIDEVQTFVEGAPSKIDGKEREGIVFYDEETGQIYTKFVSPAYLTKYH